MFYGEVFKALKRAKIKYVVAGGLAVNLYGYSRFTKDIDLIVHLEKKNLDALFETLNKIGYVPKVPVTKEQFLSKKQRKEWEKEKGMIVFSFVEKDPPFKIIDIFMSEPFPYKMIDKNKFTVKIKRSEIPLLSIKQLKELKLKAGRVQDCYDVVQLDEIMRRQRHDK